jgi:type VI secretion system secreted protein VgrG
LDFFGRRPNKMHKLKYLTISIILTMSLSLAGPSFYVSARPLAATSPVLVAAKTYSVLAGSIVTNTGLTTMPGDLGVSPSIGVPPHYTGFPPGIVGPPGTIHDADAHAAAAQADNTAAFGTIDQPCDVTYPGVFKDLVGLTLVPGVYCAAAFELSGTLTLSGFGGVWIFKSASTLITSGTANVVGGNAFDVWWRVVSSATLGTNTSLIGNILALTSISLKTGARLNGRALAQTGAVTLESNTITGPICDEKMTATPTNTPRYTPTNTPRYTPTNTPTTYTPTTTTTPTATRGPFITALPRTGGAPVRNEDFPWSLVIVGGFSAIALVFGVRAYRRTYLPKQ